MELVNATGMDAQYTLGLDPDGRERVVVAVKGTFTIPPYGSAPVLAEEQVPLVMADEFTGEPGVSAVLYESDFAAYKPKCDVLVNGSAHAPGGQPAHDVMVGLRVGPIEKLFNVVGDRVWEEGAMGLSPSGYEPFTQMPISYDRAWGGVDTAVGDPEKIEALMANPVGIGFYPVTEAMDLPGRRLPNTEELGQPTNDANGKYRSMSFGPIGRNFESRIPYAGTYDQDWIDNVFPFLPKDFDPLYFQSAPPDQQMDYPTGGEWVELTGLAPEGRTLFQIPEIEMPVEFTDIDYAREEMSAVIDTVIVEPNLGRFMVVWRSSRPLRSNILELKECAVGRMTNAWYRARALGKEYYPSIQQLIEARTEDEEDAA